MFNSMEKDFKSLVSTSSTKRAAVENAGKFNANKVLPLRTRETRRTDDADSVAQKPAQSTLLNSRSVTAGVKQAFWAKVNIGPECWEWTGSLANGYGSFRVSGTRRRSSAHRVSWFIHRGEDPGDLLICHHCDNPRCVRPDHLFLGTALDNSHDKLRKGRDRYARNAGSRNPRAKIGDEDARQVFRAIMSGQTNKAIAKRFGLSHAMVSKMRLGHSWHEAARSVGYAPKPSKWAPKSGRSKARPDVGLSYRSKRRDW